MLLTFVVCLITFTLLYVTLLVQRYRVEALTDAVRQLKQQLEEQEILS